MARRCKATFANSSHVSISPLPSAVIMCTQKCSWLLFEKSLGNVLPAVHTYLWTSEVHAWTFRWRQVHCYVTETGRLQEVRSRAAILWTARAGHQLHALVNRRSFLASEAGGQSKHCPPETLGALLETCPAKDKREEFVAFPLLIGPWSLPSH